MHHSDDPSHRVFTCYLDDSGSEDAAFVTILGGCLLDKDDFTGLAMDWTRLLKNHRIDALHMNDFVRPHGKYVGIFPEMKKALFSDAAKIITRRRKYSISVRVATKDYRDIFPVEFSSLLLSPVAIAFIGVMIFNFKIGTDNRGYPHRIAYLVDEGNSTSQQMLTGHSLLTKLEQRNRWSFTGALTFENDVHNPALQAADVIAWTCRRHFSGDGLKDEFTPLVKLFEKRFGNSGLLVRPHFDYEVDRELLVKMREVIEKDRGTDLEADIQKVLAERNASGRKKQKRIPPMERRWE